MREPISSTIEAYLDYCKNIRQMTPATLYTKHYNLERIRKQMLLESLEDLTQEKYNIWVKERLSEGQSKSYINTLRKSIVSLIKYYEECGGHTPLNPYFIPKMNEDPPRRNYYKPEEISFVASQADGQTCLMIRIAFETGMRINELRSLRLSSFDGRAVSYIAKGNKRREGYISAETAEMLQNYIRIWNIKDYLWIGTPTKTKPLTTQNMRLHMDRAFEACGFTDFYPHSLRHSFATELQLRGATIEEIRVMMGHTHTSTTEAYLHGLEGGALRILYEKYQNRGCKI